MLPERHRQRLLWEYRLRRLVVGTSSQREFRRLEHRGAATNTNDPPVGVRVRVLDGRPVWVRPGTTDASTLVDTFWWAYHLPPKEMDLGQMHTIWDLGSNVGFTVAHFAQLCPAARVVGVELDGTNAAMARTNVTPWAERCEVVQAGVWTEDGTVSYRRDQGQEYGFRVAPLIQDDSEPNASAPALSLNSLLAEKGRGRIDFVKMDIEGAESRVLRENTEWAASVTAIKVEIHDPYSVPDCIADLHRLGFDTRADDKHPACVVGVRRPG